MKVTGDINVLLDVFQRREPYLVASAKVVDMVSSGEIAGVCPAHGLTTLYYLVRRHSSKPAAELAIDHVLRHFEVGDLKTAEFREARALPFSDFEDAVVSIVAKSSGSSAIVTRNVEDFDGSPVPALTPADFLSRFTD